MDSLFFRGGWGGSGVTVLRRRLYLVKSMVADVGSLGDVLLRTSRSCTPGSVALSRLRLVAARIL